MSKKNQPIRNYVPVSIRVIDQPIFKKLSGSAVKLYLYLCECRYKLGNDFTGTFARSNDEMLKDTGMSLGSLKHAKKELIDSETVMSVDTKGWKTKYTLWTPKQDTIPKETKSS